MSETRLIGEQLQLDGVETVLAADTAVNRGSFREYAERALAQLIRSGEPFTADDIRDRIPLGIEPHHPNVLPAVIRTAATRGQITPTGWCKSTRSPRHASVNRIWVATHHVAGGDQ